MSAKQRYMCHQIENLGFISYQIISYIISYHIIAVYLSLQGCEECSSCSWICLSYIYIYICIMSYFTDDLDTLSTVFCYNSQPPEVYTLSCPPFSVIWGRDAELGFINPSSEESDGDCKEAPGAPTQECEMPFPAFWRRCNARTSCDLSDLTVDMPPVPSPCPSLMYLHVVYSCVDGQYWPLTRYVKLRFAHAPGIPGTFSPPPTSKETTSLRPRHASRHVRDARAVMHVGIVNPRWRGKRSRHPRCMRNPQFDVSGKRSMAPFIMIWRHGMEAVSAFTGHLWGESIGNRCIHQSRMDSPTHIKGPVMRGYLTFSLSLYWTNCWTNGSYATGLRRHGRL